jgi:hypothetical protein
MLIGKHVPAAQQQDRPAVKEPFAREGYSADYRRCDLLLLEEVKSGQPALKLLVAIIVLAVAAVKPFWAKLSEGLADLAIELLRNKLRRDHPGLFKENKEQDKPALPEAPKEIAQKKRNPCRKASGPRRIRRNRKLRSRGRH